MPVGQAPQALNYVSNAVPKGDGTTGLFPLGTADLADHVWLTPDGIGATGAAPTSVSLFDQGLVQVLQAWATGLVPGTAYVLAFSDRADGKGQLEPLAAFTANPAGAAIVNGIGPIRQIVRGAEGATRHYLVIAPQGLDGRLGPPLQVQSP